jgi:signal transduction histidine kinase
MDDAFLDNEIEAASLLEAEAGELKSLMMEAGDLELRLEEQAVSFERQKIELIARAEADAERRFSARLQSELETLRREIDSLKAELLNRDALLEAEEERSKTQKESLLQVIRDLEEKSSSLARLSQEEASRLSHELEGEKKARQAAEIRNSALEASSQLMRQKIEELEAARLKAEETSFKLKENAALLEQEKSNALSLIESEKLARQNALLENERLKKQISDIQAEKLKPAFDSAPSAKLSELEKEVSALKIENASLKKDLDRVSKPAEKGEELKIQVATHVAPETREPESRLSESSPLDSGNSRNDEPEQLKIQMAGSYEEIDAIESLPRADSDPPPAAIPMDLSFEPQWMKALDAIREPLISAQTRVKQLSSLRLAEGPRAVLGLALGSLAQALDTLKTIGEFLGEAEIPGTLGRLEKALEPPLSIWEPVFRRKRIVFSRRIPAILPPVVFSPASLRIAVYQILRNAYEAMPKGGTLKVSAEEDAGRNQIKVVFSDSGPGFSTAALSQLFVPFMPLRPGHLGLGLSLARRILRRYGGDIEAENGSPRGAVLTLWLAKADAAEIPPLAET